MFHQNFKNCQKSWRTWVRPDISLTFSRFELMSGRTNFLDPSYHVLSNISYLLHISQLLCHITNIECLKSLISYPLSCMTYKITHISHLISIISYFMSLISHLISHISYRIPHTSNLISLVSCLKCHISYVTPQISFVTYSLYLAFHISASYLTYHTGHFPT